MLVDPPKKPEPSPVVEAVLIALFTAIATKAVDRFFTWLDKRAKKKAVKGKK